MPHRMPPTTTTIRGPNLSTHQPSMGTSQVSVTTKIVNATWMAVQSPVVLGIHGTDEQRPAVLQVGDHRHADDANDQLKPTAAGWTNYRSCLVSEHFNSLVLYRLCALSCHLLPNCRKSGLDLGGSGSAGTHDRGQDWYTVFRTTDTKYLLAVQCKEIDRQKRSNRFALRKTYLRFGKSDGNKGSGLEPIPSISAH